MRNTSWLDLLILAKVIMLCHTSQVISVDKISILTISRSLLTPLHLVVVLGLQAYSQAPVGQVEQVVLNHPTP